MMIDARSLPPDEIIETQVCVVGAGPAGITLAREFANQSFRVCLLESGGLEFDQEMQSLCDAVVVGDPYPPVPETRRRQFGGTSHTWEGQNGYQKFGFRCLPLDEIDFEQRDWLPYSGWPFIRAHLDSFYERAQKVCQIGSYAYDVETWENQKARRLPFKSDRMMTSMSQYASREPFTHEYREEIRQAGNITTLFYATVVAIETNDSLQTVTRLKGASPQGNTFTVKAQVVILATGGMENARLLLASNQQQPAGLGNQNDVVGRFFMDRPILKAKLIPYNRKIFDQTALYDIYPTQGVPVMARVRLTDETLRQERLMNNGAQLFPRPLDHQREAALALRSFAGSLKDRKPPPAIALQVGTIMRGLDYVAAAGFWSAVRKIPSLRRGDWSYLPYEKRRFSEFEIFYQIEQAPDPNNRIQLSAKRDRLGQSMTEVHWQINPIDVQHAVRVQEIWAEEFAKAGLGDYQFAHEKAEWKFEKPAMHHHMGTTRMHIDPKQGVVDANCKVHGLSNLFIAGSSVFPTSGYSNPTLTIIALSLRLADHVKTLMN